MDLVIVTPEVQAAVPAGTITVSPSTAEAMAFVTSAEEGLAALIILACAALEATKSTAASAELKTAWFAPDSRFSFDIREFHVLFGSRTGDRRLRSGEMSSWVVHSNEIENKPDGTYGSESCFRPVVQYYCREEAQSTSPPFKIPKKLDAYFRECRNDQRNQHEEPN